MKAQHTNHIMSSLMLFLDYKIQKQGEAFFNASGLFYKLPEQRFNGYHTYAAPYRGFVYDNSITGASVITGLYVNNTFVGPGQSGFHGIDYDLGYAYFSTTPNNVSGRYAVREIPVKMSDDAEITMLFDTKFEPNPRSVQSLTGIDYGKYTFPAIYIREQEGRNVPLALGGLDKTNNGIRGIIMAESNFMLDATTSILKDLQYQVFPILSGKYPFNAFGEIPSGFNYFNLYCGEIQTGDVAYISSVSVLKFNLNSIAEMRKLNPKVYVGAFEMAVDYVRFSRQ